jgi:hydrogenase/urease accessory protein HupE
MARQDPRVSAARVFAASLLLGLVLTGSPAQAHPAPFSYLDIRLRQNQLDGLLVVHVLDIAHELGLPSADALLDPAVLATRSDEIAALLAARLTLAGDGDRILWRAGPMRPLGDRAALEMTWRAEVRRPPGRLTIAAALFPYDPNHQTFVNVYERGELVRQHVLDRGRPTLVFYTGTRQGSFAVLRAFTGAGIHHIAIGPDHVLFIVGLLLLGGSVPRLLAIVSAFTVGHSVTLSLATLGMINPPAHVVEPAIALSIVYVGADNLLVGPRGRDVRPWVALFFGLVHGFGFASVLRQTGLPDNALALSLFSFNLGVEIGQAAIVVAVAFALGLVRARDARLAQRIATVGSIAVVAAGLFWFVQRLM